MNVLCSDKTGTLTEGVVRLHAAFDAEGNAERRRSSSAPTQRRLRVGLPQPDRRGASSPRPCPAATGLQQDGRGALRFHPQAPQRGRRAPTPADSTGTRDHQGRVAERARRLFERRRVGTGRRAPYQSPRSGRDASELFASLQRPGLSRSGRRVPGPDRRSGHQQGRRAADDLLGFLLLDDPPKAGSRATPSRSSGNSASHSRSSPATTAWSPRTWAATSGVERPAVLTGEELADERRGALPARGEVDIFAEVEPNQKERIILALQKAGHVVGYMGDGINDAPRPARRRRRHLGGRRGGRGQGGGRYRAAGAGPGRPARRRPGGPARRSPTR